MKLYGHLHRMADYNPQPACFALLWHHELKFRPGGGGQHVFTLLRIVARDAGYAVEDLLQVMSDKER